jgi:hypothetical protein
MPVLSKPGKVDLAFRTIKELFATKQGKVRNSSLIAYLKIGGAVALGFVLLLLKMKNSSSSTKTERGREDLGTKKN